MPPSRSTTVAHASSSSSSSSAVPPDRPPLPPLSVTKLSSSAADSHSQHSPSVLLDEATTTSTGPLAASTSFVGASSGGSPGLARDDIEMAPIAGHRRRKSSLMNPVGYNPAATGRPRATSQLNSPIHGLPQGQGFGLAEDANDSEEAMFNRSVSPKAYQSDYENFSDEDLRDDEETGLTSKEKKKKQKKKRRNTLLDQRIAQEKSLSPDEKRALDKGIARRIAINIGLVLLWYLFSLCISLVCVNHHHWRTSVAFRSFQLTLVTSTINGCSTKIASTLRSPFSRRRCTWWCSLRYQRSFYTLSLPYGRSQRTIRIWADHGTSRSRGTAQSWTSSSISPG